MINRDHRADNQRFPNQIHTIKKLYLLVQNCVPRFVAWRLQVNVKSAFKTTAQPVGEVSEVGDRAITGEHHLFVGIVEGVERVKKFFLSFTLLLEKVNVVNEQDISVPILGFEFLGVLSAYLPKEDQEKTHIVILSSSDEDFDKTRTKELYPNLSFNPKPLSKDKLKEIIDEHTMSR